MGWERSIAEKSLGVVGTAVAAIASAAVISLFTFIFPNNVAAEWIVATAKNAWHLTVAFFAYPIPLGFALVALLLIGIARRVMRARTLAEQNVSPVELELSPDAGRLLNIMVAADGAAVTLETLALATGLRMLLIQKLAEPMLDAGLLRLNQYGNNILSLTSKGRDFAFERGFTGEGDALTMLRWALR